MTAERPTLLPTGVEPIDSALGGLEAGRAHVLYGDAESGKTTMALSFLVAGLRRGEVCALVTRYKGSEAVASMAALGYDCAHDLRTGRLLMFEFVDEIVDRLAHVESLQPLLDEMGRLFGADRPQRPQRIAFDTADFIFAIQLGYGYALQISAFMSWLAQTGAASLLVVEERMADRVVQSFRANAATVLHVMSRRLEGRAEYHIAFEKGRVRAPSRRIGLGADGFVTLEVHDAKAQTLPLTSAARRRRQEGDRTGQLTMPEEAARMVAEAAASPDPFPPPPPAPAPAPPPRTAGRAGRPRVLVIDEDRVACQLVGRALAPECDIAIETDGISGLARLGSFDPDLVIVETGLPLVDGYTICRQIREASPVPVVMVTRTHVAAADRIRSAEAGADHLLVKPFSLRELAVRTRQLVARYRGRSVPAGGGLGELPGDPLVTYDEFVERLLLSSGGAARALVGCRLAARDAVETGRIVDIVRCELRPEDVLAYEPDERHLVALVLPEMAEDLAGHLSRRVRELANADLAFWVAPVAKGAAVRVLTEQFERERREGGKGVEVSP